MAKFENKNQLMFGNVTWKSEKTLKNGRTHRFSFLVQPIAEKKPAGEFFHVNATNEKMIKRYQEISTGALVSVVEDPKKFSEQYGKHINIFVVKTKKHAKKAQTTEAEPEAPKAQQQVDQAVSELEAPVDIDLDESSIPF